MSGMFETIAITKEQKVILQSAYYSITTLTIVHILVQHFTLCSMGIGMVSSGAMFSCYFYHEL